MKFLLCYKKKNKGENNRIINTKHSLWCALLAGVPCQRYIIHSTFNNENKNSYYKIGI